MNRLPDPWPVAPELADRYRREGWWDGATLTSVLAGSLARHSDVRARIWSATRPFDGSVGDLATLGRRVAAGLHARGVREGDVVAFQLPSWAECIAVFYGASLLGAVLLPVPSFYGPRELQVAMSETRARTLVVADRFRSRDHLAEVEAQRADLPALELLVVVGDRCPPWATRFDDLVDLAPATATAAPDPAAPAAIAYTSGTSADPKGIVLSHRALAADARHHVAPVIRSERPLYMGSPLSHVSGMLVSALNPVVTGTPLLVTDAWDPGQVLATMRAEGVSAGTGAAVFLTSLLEHPDFTPEHAGLIGRAFLGGSPVPRALGERAERLGITTLRAYGCTEHPTVSACAPDDPREQRLATDGRPLAGVEVRIADDGEILTRGPDLFSGYVRRSLTEEVMTPDGWYATGDIGSLDELGYLSITDRKKDIVIRGGENISASEVEELLVQMPAVAEVAVVAAPDERWGEHACAYLRLAPGAAVTLADVQHHLAARGLSPKKWPEELRVVGGDFARTSSGKIRKNVLRDELRRSATDAAGSPAART